MMLGGRAMIVESSRMGLLSPLYKRTLCHRWSLATATVVTLKMTERSLNFYENKGSLWRIQERDLNVVEEKALKRSLRESH
jgi:hypothetical protein